MFGKSVAEAEKKGKTFSSMLQYVAKWQSDQREREGKRQAAEEGEREGAKATLMSAIAESLDEPVFNWVFYR